MDDKDNFIPRYGSPLLFPEDPADGFQGNGVSRRRFLKRTGGATAATFLGWSAIQQNIRAQETEGGETTTEDESTPEDCDFWPGKAVWELPMEYDVDALIDILWGATFSTSNGPVAVTSLFVDKAGLRSHLGVTVGQKIKHEFEQTVTWEECLTQEDGKGKEPKKFKNLKWDYTGANLKEDVTIAVNGTVSLNQGKKFGYIMQTESYALGDKWTLGEVTVNPTSPNIVGSVVDRYYPGGHAAQQAGSKARAKFYKLTDYLRYDCKVVEAIGDWRGTGKPVEEKAGVGNFEFIHNTYIRIDFWFDLGTGKILHQPYYAGKDNSALKLETGKQSKVTTTDWQNNREPNEKEGVFLAAGANPAYGNIWVNGVEIPNTAGGQASSWKTEIKRPGTHVK
jgi:hypothetical protein